MEIAKIKKAIPTKVFNELLVILSKRQINEIQLSAFLAQTSHESMGFTKVSENLNYSENALLQLFRRDFDVNRDRELSESEKLKAKQLARKPQPIANFIYANQNGNGNEKSGDGWKYRGRGYLQLTGKSNYINFDATVIEDITNNPDLVATQYPLTSALWFFDSNKLWALANDPSKFEQLTKAINGGLIGIEDRKKHFEHFRNLFIQ